MTGNSTVYKYNYVYIPYKSKDTFVIVSKDTSVIAHK